MTTSAFYFNLVKILTMAFVLGFCAYVVNAQEIKVEIRSAVKNPVRQSSGGIIESRTKISQASRKKIFVNDIEK